MVEVATGISLFVVSAGGKEREVKWERENSERATELVYGVRRTPSSWTFPSSIVPAFSS